MKLKDAQLFFGGALLVFLIAPYLPTAVINTLVGYRLSALLLIVLTVYVFKKDMLRGLALFLATAALFLEYRRRTIDAIRISYAGRTGPGAPISEASRPARPLVKGEIHPSAQRASVDEHEYEPGNEDSQALEAAEAETYDSAVENEKGPLNTVAPGDSVQFFMNRGLASQFTGA
jgi:hypothetical protein